MTSPKTILIVEDHKNILKILQKYISILEYTPITVNSAEEALILLDELDGKVCLILCDIFLPGMRGDDMALKIKTKYPAIKILCMSGDDSLTLSSPDLPFIQKPFTISTLDHKLYDLLED